MAEPHPHRRSPKDPARLERARRRLAEDPAQRGMGRLRKAICDPARMDIMRALAAGQLCVNDLALAINRAPAATSQHLRVLRDLDLVRRERRGTTMYYSLNRDQAAPLQRVFNSLAAMPEENTA